MASTIQITQEVIEVLQSETPADIRLTQEVIEVMQSETPASLHLTQFVIEVARVKQSLIVSTAYQYPPTVQ